MIKLMGVVAICFSSLMLGLFLTDRLKRKVTVMQSIIQTLQIFKREITYKMPLMSELFEQCSQLPTAEFSNSVASHLHENKTLEESVHTSYKSSRCFNGFSEEEGRFITDTFSALGSGDCENQLAIIENALLQATEFLSLAVENKNKNTKLYLTTSIYIGSAIAIILI